MDVSSPTASLEALFATAVIDAKEKRKVAIFDVSGAFLHSEMIPKDGNNQHVVLRGRYVDIMC
jgi:hypothetical protein